MNQKTMPLMTLGRLVRASGLARASLLHYESLDLLVPAGRSPAGYRLYGEDALERLRTIRRFRDAGLSLTAIRELLEERQDPTGSSALLEARLVGLSREVERLRAQQKLLAGLLAEPEFRRGYPLHGKDAWVALLRRAGFSEEDMVLWHIGFEADNPDGHDAFLRSLGLASGEITEIRRMSKAGVLADGRGGST